MQVPLEITYRDREQRDEIERLGREEAAKLDQLFENLISCRVAIEQPQKAQKAGNPYRVRIDVTAPPGHELIVRREPLDNEMHATLATVLIDAFKAMRRQVEALRERQRGEVKSHDEPRALVVRVFRDAGYGFIQSVDGREIYFHRNAVIDDWDDLTVGNEVRFEEAMGTTGPQATTVHIVSGERHGVRSGSITPT